MREVMMAIRAVFIEWQANRISDHTAVRRIEKIILDNQKAEWLREHQAGGEVHNDTANRDIGS